MSFREIVDGEYALLDGKGKAEAIVLSTRVRLARNLEKLSFPDWASVEQRKEVLRECYEAVKKVKVLEGVVCMDSEVLNEAEKQFLVERHLISRELMEGKEGAGMVIGNNQSVSIMINEEDHLRIQVIRGGFDIRGAWELVDKIDTELERSLSYAFSETFGYLTACPTNLGTAMRASMMMHLPGLVMAGQMEKVIRAANQLNLAVRGIYGEGSDASGSIFQISNQQTLGETEVDIIRRLEAVLRTVIEQEHNARAKLLEEEPYRLYDKIGRAYGILRNGYYVNSEEGMNLLSLLRLGIDLRIIGEKYRRMVDKLFLESQPGHMQVLGEKGLEAGDRDIYRAEIFREKFKPLPALNFDNLSP